MVQRQYVICRYFYSLQKCNNIYLSKMQVSLGKMLVNACVNFWRFLTDGLISMA